MDLKLKDKVAIVTGTGSQIGFGKGIALTLAREGCHIVSVDLDLEGAKKQRLIEKYLNNLELSASAFIGTVLVFKIKRFYTLLVGKRQGLDNAEQLASHFFPCQTSNGGHPLRL
jgi:NAD(P)-dependent dehydrogenase (short-subunit alcohol dehydrogenase family)